MPIYEYQCINCDEFITKTKSIYEASDMEFCPNCGEVMAQVFSPPTIIFKGSGFFCTDNPKGG